MGTPEPMIAPDDLPVQRRELTPEAAELLEKVSQLIMQLHAYEGEIRERAKRYGPRAPVGP